jgi:hypothetical protein
VFTEVAFANESAIAPYNTEALPGVDNSSAAITAVWPTKARSRDYVYIIGDNFFLQHNSVASGITRTRFRIGIQDFQSEPDADLSVQFIGVRIIRVRLPNCGFTVGNADVTIDFTGGSSPFKANAVTIE